MQFSHDEREEKNEFCVKHDSKRSMLDTNMYLEFFRHSREFVVSTSIGSRKNKLP